MNHEGNERPIAQPDNGRRVDGIEQQPSLSCRENRCLAFADDNLWTLHRCGWVHSKDSAGHEVVEQHSDRRQVLLHRKVAVMTLQLFNIGSDKHGFDLRQRNLVPVCPFAEPANRPHVSLTSVWISNVRRKEFDEPSDRICTGIPDHGWNWNTRCGGKLTIAGNQFAVGQL